MEFLIFIFHTQNLLLYNFFFWKIWFSMLNSKFPANIPSRKNTHKNHSIPNIKFPSESFFRKVNIKCKTWFNLKDASSTFIPIEPSTIFIQRNREDFEKQKKHVKWKNVWLISIKFIQSLIFFLNDFNFSQLSFPFFLWSWILILFHYSRKMLLVSIAISLFTVHVLWVNFVYCRIVEDPSSDLFNLISFRCDRNRNLMVMLIFCLWMNLFSCLPLRETVALGWLNWVGFLLGV